MFEDRDAVGEYAETVMKSWFWEGFAGVLECLVGKGCCGEWEGSDGIMRCWALGFQRGF